MTHRIILRSVSIMLTAVVFLAAPVFAGKAHADLSSGLPSGPVGTPVVSTIAYTKVSDVMVVGDSITVRSYKSLAAALPGQRLAVNAQSGRNTKLSLDQLLNPTVTPHIPPVLIMATGANDIFRPTAMAAQVQRMKAGVPAGVKVYWVNVSVRRPGYIGQDTYNSMRVNQAIAKYCTGTCSVISWAGFLDAKPYRRAMYLLPDGVHPNTAGQAAWAGLIAASIK